ncbi:MAG: hypothetical protein B7Z75_09225 [Acidocella sp. 20-57-95]|nr:MAG: hypothetical protein B7Z75_09225 [Acidocella sp. 20-57-95]OYV57372.1 MAG: hypothetical protein B7Z71_12270 [Acidocella sp. 21-58-7]HQT64163.1 hypothetical protein [Acidocella sp.]HQU05079.1 hypothetical protein [Acidocella sp.]
MQIIKSRVLKLLPPVLGLLVLGAVLTGLHKALRHLSFADVLAALTNTPHWQVYHALMLLGVSVGVMMLYDVPGVYFAKQRGDCPPLAAKRIALASFCAYALSHVVGAPALSAAAIRLRLYAQWQVPPSGIGRIMTVSGTTFITGVCVLLGYVLLLHPHSVPLFNHDVPIPALRAAGALLWVLIGVYIGLAHGTQPITLFGINIPRPGVWVAVAQVVISCTDTAVACGILFAVLPSLPALTYAHVLALYMVGFAGGLLSGLPGGVGVFDSLLLLGLADYVDTATALGAILLFRVLYYLAPAAIAGLSFTIHEIMITAGRKTTVRF